METASEGGPFGMAVLTAYCVQKEDGESLQQYLEDKVFAGAIGATMQPDEADVAGFDTYIGYHQACISAEKEVIWGLSKR